MIKNLLFPNEALAILREQQFLPYAQLNEALQNQLADGVRFMQLRAGERITALAGTQISVLQGKVRLSSTGRTLNDAATCKAPHMISQRGDILQALEDAALILADCDFLDLLTSWHALVQHVKEMGDAAAMRLEQLQRAKPFQRLPLDCAASAVMCMQPRHAAAGLEIQRQGVPGESFFVILSGRAEAWQQGFNDHKAHLVAQLKAGDTFGDEALIVGAPTAVSVRMVSDGELLELPRKKFLELLARPRILEVTPATAKDQFESGWIVLDVRHAEEFEAGHYPQSQLLPLEELRAQCAVVLSRARRYVTVCNSGKRSAVAALMLAERGYQVVSLKHGLRNANFRMVLSEADAQDKAVA